MKREIIHIDDEKCNGCALCIPNCHEGALQIIDGKARLISDLMCDGLGACIGHCPEGAITLEEREAEPYDEIKVMEVMMEKGKNTIIAHLKHLKEHGETDFLKQGVGFLVDHQDQLDFPVKEVLSAVHHSQVESAPGCGCQGSQTQTFGPPKIETEQIKHEQPSALTHWPVQMHLINPGAAHFRRSHLILAADCTAFTLGNFHSDFLQGKTLAIACPKLDSNREVYVDKLQTLIDESEIDMMTVMIMEVPCCGGLTQLVDMALSNCKRQIPIKIITVSVRGEILNENWHRVA